MKREVLLWLTLYTFGFAMALAGTALGIRSEPTPAPAYATAAANTLDVLEDVIVIDGDTLKGTIRLGRKVALRDQRIRLAGFDAWETTRRRRTVTVTADEIVKGKAATEALATLIREAEIVCLSDGGRDIYGRCLGRLRLIERDGSVVNVEHTMIAAGHDRSVDSEGNPR